MKKSSYSFFDLVAFVLFVIWGVGTLLNIVLGFFNVSLPAAGVVEQILRICSIIVMVYCAFMYYNSHKSNKAVCVLFWLSVIVALVVLFLPIFL